MPILLQQEVINQTCWKRGLWVTAGPEQFGNKLAISVAQTTLG